MNNPVSPNPESFLAKRLGERAEQGNLRKLALPDVGLIDFSSNDYLGFAKEPQKVEFDFHSGSTGSRLLTGNSAKSEQLEETIAQFLKAESGLLFNAGYTANLGLLSALGTPETTLIYDELVHASIHDGIRLSKAKSFRFKHNDVNHLRERLQAAKGTTFVIIESVYSMDGDLAPMAEIADLCEVYHAGLIVDEAHATGVFGECGEGLSVALKLQDKVFARVHTFGKAMGCHGAIVLGGKNLRNYLVNFSKPFIYSTAPGEMHDAAIEYAFNKLNNNKDRILLINQLINVFKEKIDKFSLRGVSSNSSPIQTVLIPGNDAAKALSDQLKKDGFDVRPILSPTVPKGSERLRICLHTFNTPSQIEGLLTSIQKHVK